jgi:hypothetical protein
MNRREFIKAAFVLPMGFGFSKTVLATDEDLKSFGYYQGLLPTEKRSPSRTDGTYSGMPLILRDDIDAAVEKTYDFWHGHGAKHKFTLTENHFIDLQDGRTIEVYTTVISGHRHALRIVGT